MNKKRKYVDLTDYKEETVFYGLTPQEVEKINEFYRWYAYENCKMAMKIFFKFEENESKTNEK